MAIYIPDTFKTNGSTPQAVDFQSPLTPENATIGTRSMSNMAEGLSAIGKSLVKSDVDALNKAFNLRIQDGVNQLNSYAQLLKNGNKDTGEKGYGEYLGGQIFDSKAFEGQSLGVFYNEKFQKKINEISNGLPPLARDGFLQKAQEPQNIFNSNLTSWENQQTRNYNIDLGTNTVYQGQDMLKNAQNIDEAKFALNTIDGGFKIVQESTGKSNLREQALVRSSGLSEAIKLAISQNDTARAQSFLNFFGKDIDPDDRVRINKAVAGAQEQELEFGIQEWSNAKGQEDIARRSGGSIDLFHNVIVPIEGGEDAQGKPLVSQKGAVGVSQLLPKTAEAMAKKLKIPYDENRLESDRDYNLQLGQAVFDELLIQFNYNPLKAAVAYNGGPKAVYEAEKLAEKAGKTNPDAWEQYIPTEEGRGYLAKVKERLPLSSKQAPISTKDQFVSRGLADFERQYPDSDPKIFKKVESSLTATYTNMERQYNAGQDEIVSFLTAQVKAGSVGEPAPLDMVKFSQLSESNQKKIIDFQNAVTSGKTIITNSKVFNEAWNNPNLPDTNLDLFASQINQSDLIQLKKRQEDMRGKDLNEIRWNDERISKIITDNTKLKIDSLQFVDLRNKISEDVRQAQERTGKRLSSDEISGIAKLATSNLVFESTNFFGKPVLKSKDIKDFEGATESVLLNPEEIKNATILFKSNFGKDPTPQELKDFVINYKKGRAQ